MKNPNSFGHVLCSKDEAGIHCDKCGKPLQYREPIAENGKQWFHEECFQRRMNIYWPRNYYETPGK